MKKILISLVCSFGLISIIYGCKKSLDEPSTSTIEIALHNCNEKTGSAEPYICFDSLFTDSRCPKDVQCVWSGYALIKVSFHENNNTHVFNMITPAVNKSFGGVSDTTINGYKISFTDLLPHPVSTTPTSPNNLKAIIQIAH